MKILIPFIRLFARQWVMMSIGLGLTLTTLMAGIGLLSLSGWFLSATAVAGLTLATAQLFNFFTPAGGVRFLSIARTASRYGERLATHEATFKLLTELRVWAWQKLFPLSAKDLQGLRRADMLNRLVADIDTLDHLYLRLLTPMAASLLVTGLLYLFLAWFDAKLALSLCLLLLAAWCVLPWLFYRLGHGPSRAMLETKRQYRVQLLDILQGQAELTLFGADGRYRQRLDEAETALYRSQSTMANITALSQ
ncbi:MAG: heme ABC transporter ATP-binding protein/permease CydC, partial [Shewanella sp.]